jgi:hypothetical protein
MIPSVVINSGFKGFVNLHRAVVYNYIICIDVPSPVIIIKIIDVV